MKALVFHGPGQRGWDTVNDPTIIDPTDIVVRIDSSTICGTDLHILKGDVPVAAYDTFADAATTGALKVVLEGSERDRSSNGRVAADRVAGRA
jgi:threonine dehydrogenase-like Zn-dependent dehydrogenase